MALFFVNSNHLYGVLSVDPLLIVIILCMCLFSTLVANFLIIYAICRMDSGMFSILTTLTTVESTLFGIMVFGENITLFEITGMVLIVMVILEFESLSEYGRSKTPGSGTGCVQDQ